MKKLESYKSVSVIDTFTSAVNNSVKSVIDGTLETAGAICKKTLGITADFASRLLAIPFYKPPK